MAEKATQPTIEDMKANLETMLPYLSELAAHTVHYDIAKSFHNQAEEIEYLRSQLEDCIKFARGFAATAVALRDVIGYTENDRESHKIIIREGDEAMHLKKIVQEIKLEIIPFFERCLELEIETELVNEKMIATLKKSVIEMEIFIAGAFKE